MAALVAVMVIAGCGGSDDPAEAPPVSQPPDVPSLAGVPSVAPEHVPVLDAYRGMWAAYDRAGMPPVADPDAPDLARYAVDDALEVLTDLLTSFREDGLVFSGELMLTPRVTELSPQSRPDHARVEDCVDSSGWEVVRADGEPHEDDPGGRRLVFADVENGQRGWMVTVLSIGSVGTC